VPALCRDCDAETGEAPLCRRCGGGRILRHPELFDLTIAHVDCDAFYASVEKRDRPELAARPVIVGGGVRGVVSAACYVARLYGVRSAMPMFKALKACPDAVVIRPDFSKYVAVARQIRTLMGRLTPLVQPLSIDEAVLDLAGTAALHGGAPAQVLARFAREVEREIGVTVSIGLAANRLLAKIAAGRDKPRGFCAIGREAADLLAPEPVRLLPGIGPAFARRLAELGITRLGHLQAMEPREALRRLGEDGPALVRRARGEDDRRVDPGRETKSVSAETTFGADLTARPDLERQLWRLAEKLARRLREQDLAAGGVVLKLKTSRFALRTRTQRLAGPTQLPDLLVRGRACPARPRGGRDGVPADRHWRAAGAAGQQRRSDRSRRPRPAAPHRRPSGDRCLAGAVRRRRDRARPGLCRAAACGLRAAPLSSRAGSAV
jgi:DNA polymerase-4